MAFVLMIKISDNPCCHAPLWQKIFKEINKFFATQVACILVMSGIAGINSLVSKEVSSIPKIGIAMRYRKVSIPERGMEIRYRKVLIPGRDIEIGYRKASIPKFVFDTS